MTTTLTTIHDRITCVLADVAPNVLTEKLAELVWELEDVEHGIGTALADIEHHAQRMRQVFDAGQSLDFDARLLVSKQMTLSERLNDREVKLQLIMQMVALLQRMTGTNPAALRSAVFGSAS